MYLKDDARCLWVGRRATLDILIILDVWSSSLPFITYIFHISIITSSSLIPTWQPHSGKTPHATYHRNVHDIRVLPRLGTPIIIDVVIITHYTTKSIWLAMVDLNQHNPLHFKCRRRIRQCQFDSTNWYEPMWNPNYYQLSLKSLDEQWTSPYKEQTNMTKWIPTQPIKQRYVETRSRSLNLILRMMTDVWMKITIHIRIAGANSFHQMPVHHMRHGSMNWEITSEHTIHWSLRLRCISMDGYGHLCTSMLLDLIRILQRFWISWHHSPAQKQARQRNCSTSWHARLKPYSTNMSDEIGQRGRTTHNEQSTTSTDR